MDEEIRRAERAPADDGASAKRLAAQLSRIGDVRGAVRELLRAAGGGPDAEGARELSRLTRGGMDPAAPWAAYRGDARRTRRGTTEGPRRGAVAGGVRVGLVVKERAVVDGEGWIVVASDPQSSPPGVYRIPPQGGVVERIAARGSYALLLAEGLVVLDPPDRSWIVRPGSGAVELSRSPCFVALGHLVTLDPVEGVGVLSAYSFEAPTYASWSIALGPDRVAPMVDGSVVTFGVAGVELVGHVADAASTKLVRLDLLTGAGLRTWPLAGRGDELVLAADGTAFLRTGCDAGPAGLVAAYGPNGLIWSTPTDVAPVALAGPAEEVLVGHRAMRGRPLRDGEADGLAAEDSTVSVMALEPGCLRGFDASSGRPLWDATSSLGGSGPLQVLAPVVDVRGTIHVAWTRDVIGGPWSVSALDPLNGAVLQDWSVGAGPVELVLGDRRAFILRRLPAERATEVFILE